MIRWLWPWRWLGVVVLLGWLGVMFQLYRHQSIRSAKKLEELFPWAVQKPLKTGTEWMGIYLKNKKIGYTRLSTTRLKKGFSIAQRSFLHMKLLGRAQKIRLHSTVQVNRKYRLERFHFRLHSGFSVFDATGKVSGTKLEILLTTGGFQRRFTLPYKPALLSSVLRPYIAAQKPPIGQRIAATLFDPQDLSYTKTVIVVEKREQIVVHGKKYRAIRLRQRYRGLELLAWIDDQGRVLKEFSASGMLLLRETAITAPKGIQGGYDVIRATRVKLQGRIAQAETRSSLRLHLSGVSLSAFSGLQGLRQRLTGSTLSIVKHQLASLPRLPFAPAKAPPQTMTPATSRPSGPPLSRYMSLQRPPPRPKKLRRLLPMPLQQRALLATPFIQSKHPKIRARALAITAGAKDRIAALKALMQWVFAAIKKQNVAGIPSALEVLDKRIGDCNEHATLYAALARSVKIPCAITSGLAYRKGSFYFHAWNECYVGKQKWLSLDATWGQMPSDVTHIAFVRGGLDKQTTLLRLLGKLHIRVVE